LRGDYPVAVICRVLHLPRRNVSAHDRGSGAGPPARAEAALRFHIEPIATTWPTDGSRRVAAQLRRAAEPIAGTNSKRVRRLMHAWGLVGKAPVRRRCRTTNRAPPYPRFPNLVRDREVDHPDHVWVGDITDVRLRLEFVYLAVLMEVFTRAMRGWELARSLDQALTFTAWERALEHGHVPQLHHADQGVQ
jgi:putative transposase